ncbi:MAG: amidohydrolase [Acidobacteria bacterium]|nr:MAG: amidohydrolase [Acidobacteriota bacterium]
MGKYTRGEFLGFGAALAGAFSLGRLGAGHLEPSVSAQPSTSGGEPDLIVVNARVLTSDAALPRAEAFAVRSGRFVAVGSSADVRNLATARAPIIDAQTMTVVPGFIDAHCHPSGVEELYGVNTNLRTVREIQSAIRRKAESSSPEIWITGFMFDDTKLDRPLTRKDLDEATTEHPVSVAHRGGHTSFYNSKAFELAGITARTPDPPDGRYFKENGELNGRVAENARNVFSRVGKRETFTPEQRRDRARNGMKHMSQLFNACGLTSVHNAGTSQDHILAYEDCRKNGELTHRAYMMIRSPQAFTGLKAANISTGFGDEWIRVGGVKFVADGSASERTMRMSTPYVGTNDYGILTMTQEQLHEAIDDAHSHGFQVGVHANGDVTIDMVLKAYERALQKWPDPNRRHRIEHCTLVNPDLIRRIKANGVIPTPFWTYVYYHGEKWKEYGDEKVAWMFAHKSFLDAGIRVPGASDYTPGPFEPLMAIQSMVTRKDYKGRVWGPNQKVTVDQALTIATINGAYASSEEHLKGSIAAGKLADFVILEKDPHDVDPDQIMNIKVNRTVVGGKTVYGG